MRVSLPAVVAVLSLTVSGVGMAQPLAAQTLPSPDKAAEAYWQYLLGRHLETADDIDGAITAFKRAAQLDPAASDVTAELSGLFMRQNRLEEAIAAADQALKIQPANREAHRVLGIVYATLVENGRRGNGRGTATPQENLAKAIQHLEQALDRPIGESDPNVRATLARLYLSAESYDKAIPLLVDLVNQEPGWSDGPTLLAQAYAKSGRSAEAISWLMDAAPDDPDLYPTLAGFYEREGRWSEAAGAYAQAIKESPRSAELKTQYVSALMNAGGRESLTRARDVLNEILSAKPADPRALFQLSQVQRRMGDYTAAEDAARKIIARRVPWGTRHGARGAASVSVRRRRARAGCFGVQGAPRHEPGHRSGTVAAASGVRVPGARGLRQGDRRIRGSAPARANRYVDHRVRRAGESVGQEVRGGARAGAEGARREWWRPALRAARGAGAPPDRET
jgi:tetratricopeptide (TPR) repeat protein